METSSVLCVTACLMRNEHFGSIQSKAIVSGTCTLYCTFIRFIGWEWSITFQVGLKKLSSSYLLQNMRSGPCLPIPRRIPLRFWYFSIDMFFTTCKSFGRRPCFANLFSHHSVKLRLCSLAGSVNIQNRLQAPRVTLRLGSLPSSFALLHTKDGGHWLYWCSSD